VVVVKGAAGAIHQAQQQQHKVCLDPFFRACCCVMLAHWAVISPTCDVTFPGSAAAMKPPTSHTIQLSTVLGHTNTHTHTGVIQYIN
jgi:hypothetical protein